MSDEKLARLQADYEAARVEAQKAQRAIDHARALGEQLAASLAAIPGRAQDQVRRALEAGETPDLSALAMEQAALELERDALPKVLRDLESAFRLASSQAESCASHVADYELEQQHKELKAQVQAMRNRGESHRTIQETLRLSESEFERLIAA